MRFYWSAIFDVPGLGDGDRLAYIALVRYRNEKTGLCNPSLVELATCMRCDLTTVARRLERLERAQAIRRRRSRGRRRTEYVPLLWSETSVPNRGADVSVDSGAGAMVAASNSGAGAMVAASNSGAGASDNSGAGARSTVARAPREHAKEHAKGTREVLPAVSANSRSRPTPRAEEEAALTAVIEAVRGRRSPPLSRDQAREARKIARDRLRAGWTTEQIVGALVATTAFSSAAVDFAASGPKRRGSAAQRSQEVLERRIQGGS